MRELRQILPEIVKVLDEFKKEGLIKNYALIGGMAMAAKGLPRATKDLDFLLNADEILFREGLTKKLEAKGYLIKVYKGDFNDPLRSLIRILDKDKNPFCDLILIHWKWQEDIGNSAEEIFLDDIPIPIAKVEDLIVLKLKAGGPRDLLDVQELLTVVSHLGSLDKSRLLSLSKRAGVDRRLKQLLQGFSWPE